MRWFETAVFRAVRGGEVVNYEITPIYGNERLPGLADDRRAGSDGFERDVMLHDRDDVNGVDG